MKLHAIDVWNLSTFDPALIGMLEAQADLIRGHHAIDHKNFLAYDLGRERSASMMRPGNPFAYDFCDFQEAIGREMDSRTIRAYHYTRMTDDEVALLRSEGIYLSTPEALQRRFDALVAAGAISRVIADELYAKSPFHSEQFESRSNKFWMASHPIETEDSGVRPLMSHWGGEVASMCVQDQALVEPLTKIGKGRIVEVAVPMAATRHSYHAGRAVVATFARSLGCIPEKMAFDLYTKEPLPSSAILAVHTEGDVEFGDIGRSYPTGFVNVDIGRWKELTGEDG